LDREFIAAVEQDCLVLLQRAFNGKTVTAFGIDGLGLYGTSDVARTFHVLGVDTIQVTEHNDTNKIRATARISLEGYDATSMGFIATDRNLQISMNQHLKSAGIDPQCWTWGHVDDQGRGSFQIILDVNRLIEW
jgi:hypothetical protein